MDILSFLPSIGKLLKYGVFTAFIGATAYLCMKMVSIVMIFPGLSIVSLVVSCIVFVVILAVKRGVWH